MSISRKTNGGCACRVPLNEVCMPAGLHDGDALQWLADRGVDVASDHMGRLSIPVSDAQYLWDDAAKRATDEVAEKALIRGQVHTANLRRLAIFEEVTTAGMRGGGTRQDVKAARAAAWTAVAEYDKTLSKAVRERVDALPLALSFEL